MRSPLGTVNGEYEILSSRFEAILGPLSDPESFKAIYDEVHKTHPKGDHYAYAYSLGDITKSSDDGEPGGAAGRPLLSLLEEQGIVNCYIIVVRFFGGTKLGIPRLRRSFLEAANDAIKNGKFGTHQSLHLYHLEVDYSVYETLKNYSSRLLFRLEDTEFDLKVKTNLVCSKPMEPAFEKMNLPLAMLGIPEIIDRLVEEELL